MVKIERTYNVPLRKGFFHTPKYRKSKKAMDTLRLFLKKHMKSNKILIGKHLNEEIWKHGIKNPPHHVRVNVIRDDDGTVRAELYGFKYEHKTKEEREKEKPKKEEVKEEKKEAKKEEVKEHKEEKAEIKEETKEKKEIKKEKPKEVKKEVKKEIKKEHKTEVKKKK